jgi:hypothetical protein
MNKLGIFQLEIFSKHQSSTQSFDKRIVSGKARKGIHTTVLIVEICNLIQYIGVVDLL